MKEYLETIVKPLLKEPEALTIDETHDAMGILLSVRVSKNDMGTCIGRSGKMADAIRHLVRTYGGLNQAAVAVKFIEPLGSTHYQNITESK